jgi:adenylate cyclase
MATEIERKFLVLGDDWRHLAEGVPYRQAYLNQQGPTVRVRVVRDQGYLTIKGPTVNTSRLEYEYLIPVADAHEMLDRLAVSPVVEKLRYTIEYQGFVWVVDEFSGENSGLVMAELELEYPEQSFPLPPWIGQEVSGDPRFYNASLARNPFSRWGETFFAAGKGCS